MDVNFVKVQIINKNTSTWDSTIFGLITDPDLGDAIDDYMGCDITKNLGFCYNSDNTDGNGLGATMEQIRRQLVLKCSKAKSGNTNLGMTSFGLFYKYRFNRACL